MTDVRGAHSHSASPKENGHTVASPVQPNFPPPSAGNVPEDTPVSSTSELTQTWVHLAKTFVLIFPIYALGYFEFSFSWLLIGLVIVFWWRRNTGGKHSRLNRALAFFEQEERSVKQSLTTSDLPPWVHFPDVERVEWLNKTVKQMWPYICQFVDKLFHETIEPAVKESNSHLSTFCFSKIDIGDKPLRVNGVKVYTENVDKRQIIMDLQIRVVMEPLLGDMPLVGALSVFFLKKPLLDINWTGLTNILDIPGLNGFSDSLIQDIIYSYLVLPNRITIPLVGDVELAMLRFPMPKGVLRIHFLEAQDLEGKDTFLGGLIKGKSDPYGILQIGNQLFQSKTIKESLHPKWNEVYEVTSLGCFWFNLEETSTGKLHLKMEWLALLANDGLSSALLVVYLDSAKNLPVRYCNAHYILMLIRFKTKEPLWEDCYSFLVHNPRRQELEVQVKDDKHKCNLGNLTVPLSSLLAEEDMTLTQCFPLKNSGPSSTIKLKMALRVRNNLDLYHLCLHYPCCTNSAAVCGSDTELLWCVYSGSAPSQYPLGEVQLTVRHSSQRNKLIVVVHACRNLIAFTKDSSDPFIRLYLLPDKSRTGRRKTSTMKRTLNPVYDQTFEFSVSMVELHRRTLDVAVKNGGSILSKHKGLLGKVLVDLSGEDISKGWTQWYDLSEDGFSSQGLRNIQDPLLT
uniref:Extended synaptotagmin-like protein 2b n=1 Tax=Dicentrarchus labrax TaxID=13489 RepID=A0A8C4F1R8_DICLA